MARRNDDMRNELREEKVFNLKTIRDLERAHEWVFNQQVNGKLDPKTADSLNTTLKGSMYLSAKLKLDAAKLLIQARIKKLDLPPGLLPAGLSEESE